MEESDDVNNFMKDVSHILKLLSFIELHFFL